jgi:hypothetical protein
MIERKTLYRWLQIHFIEDGNGGVIFPSRPVERVTRHLYQANAYRIAKEITELPDYLSLRYAILGAFLNCPEIESFLPEQYRKNHELTLIRSHEGKNAEVIWAHGIRKQEVNAAEWTKISKIGSSAFIELGEFLRTTTLSLPQAFAVQIRLVNHDRHEDIVAQAKHNGPSEEFWKKLENSEIEFTQDPYVSTMAKLKYLIGASVRDWSIPETAGREGEFLVLSLGQYCSSLRGESRRVLSMSLGKDGAIQGVPFNND